MMLGIPDLLFQKKISSLTPKTDLKTKVPGIIFQIGVQNYNFQTIWWGVPKFGAFSLSG